MRIRITEDQLDKVKELESYKKSVFKYWDKFGHGINKTMLSMFGFNDRSRPVSMLQLQSWLREYLGENSSGIMKKFFSKPEYKVDCGGYDFTFIINNYHRDGHQFEIFLTVDDIRGTVMLVMTDGTIHKIKDARENEDYGWEIDNEIAECIYDYFIEHIENTTGFSFVVGRINYKSEI
jgi:hypothetical protein